ncbi:Uncharacterized protein Adt_10011 [Abeliophyllum distichum]|uniref:Uncharacterized protein n=1 Tax=Abeliophyllum distichum TaxID=126358 RepID=A0ABD1UIZ3_9LAMI
MIGKTYPRMLKWKTDVHVTGPQLEEEVFKHSQLEVIQFVATNEEENEIYVSGLFHKKQTTNEFGASSLRPAPEFLNQFGKEAGGSSYTVLDKQIVLYSDDSSLGRKQPSGEKVSKRWPICKKFQQAGVGARAKRRYSKDRSPEMVHEGGVEKGTRGERMELLSDFHNK